MVINREKRFMYPIRLLRTVYSIVGNTPTNLLREVILVDDGSVNGN